MGFRAEFAVDHDPGHSGHLNTAIDSLGYAPNPGFTGSDSLQISITDPSDNLTSSATVPIAVPPLLINAPQS